MLVSKEQGKYYHGKESRIIADNCSQTPMFCILNTVWLKISQYLLEGSWTFSLRFKRRETPSISSQSRIPLLGAADSSSLTPAAGTQSPPAHPKPFPEHLSKPRKYHFKAEGIWKIIVLAACLELVAACLKRLGPSEDGKTWEVWVVWEMRAEVLIQQLCKKGFGVKQKLNKEERRALNGCQHILPLSQRCQRSTCSEAADIQKRFCKLIFLLSRLMRSTTTDQEDILKGVSSFTVLCSSTHKSSSRCVKTPMNHVSGRIQLTAYAFGLQSKASPSPNLNLQSQAYCSKAISYSEKEQKYAGMPTSAQQQQAGICTWAAVDPCTSDEMLAFYQQGFQDSRWRAINNRTRYPALTETEKSASQFQRNSLGMRKDALPLDS
ncbi:hypothetical protein Anapl_08039 [Anas platyrhynchos]|uniref:Uncharacterized protein n=1 Tax=Anas platyrhynchos TaxID=8839 RepID=R0KFB2_ANAPL|nr:hypothetical protein Anapl_08039 [Anas platyrhynchos]